MSSSRFAVATLSLGSCDSHRLEAKLRAAAAAGFTSVELFTPDWEKYVEIYLSENHLVDSHENHLAAACNLRSLLDSLHLRVNCLQPLRGVEGIADPVKRQEKFDSFRTYLPICNVIETDLILCCSSTEPDACGDVETISRDLVELADIAAEWHQQHGGKLVRVGYEALSWGTHVNTWSQAWKCVNHTPRPNLGLIVDSFNALAREYADPYSLTGLQRSMPASLAFLRRHLNELVSTVPGNKIFLFQIADAGLPAPSSPFSSPPSDESGVPKLQPWSRNFRLFPMETDRGAYLPVAQYAQAVLSTGYKGDLSCEVFNASLHETSSEVPAQHAQRAYVGLQRLEAALSDLARDSKSHPAQSEKTLTDLVSEKLQRSLAVTASPTRRAPLSPLQPRSVA